MIALMSCFAGTTDRWEKGQGYNPRRDIEFWALSMALNKQHNDELRLVCDFEAGELLTQFPFDYCHIVGEDEIKEPHRKMWALSKFHAYRHMLEEGYDFLHIDHDFFWWNPPPLKLSNKAVIAQSPEHVSLTRKLRGWSWLCHAYPIERLRTIPFAGRIRHYLNKEEHFAKNTGVFGVNPGGLRFLEEYVYEFFDIFDRPENQKWFEEMPPTLSVIFLEQYVLGALAESLLEPIHCILPQCPTDAECEQLGISHFYGPTKSDWAIKMRVWARLLRDFPDYFESAIRLAPAPTRVRVQSGLLNLRATVDA